MSPERKLANLLLLTMLCLASVPSIVEALTCTIDYNPDILAWKSPIALCTVENANTTACYTYLSDPEDPEDVWGVMPEPSNIAGVGRIESYQVSRGSVMVEFSRNRAYYDTNITGTVTCGTETASFNMTPNIFTSEEGVDWFIWSGKNLTFIIGAALLLIILGAIITIIWRTVR